MIIKYDINVSSADDIFLFLLECDDSFIPKLSSRVNIQEYSIKIFTNSIRFEAWIDDVMAGLIAMYVNKSFGYITNVSVSQKHMNYGIASDLMTKCIEYSKSVSIKKITLEVSENNFSAIKLYEKFSFKVYQKNDDSMFMHLIFE